MPAAIRALNVAAIARLKTVVTLVGGRVFTAPVPQGAAYPYLVVGDFSERSAENHYAGAGNSSNGLNIRGVARLSHGMDALLALWEQVHEALHDAPLDVTGHGETIGELRYITDYLEPTDSSLGHFVSRLDALTVVQ